MDINDIIKYAQSDGSKKKKAELLDKVYRMGIKDGANNFMHNYHSLKNGATNESR